MCATETRSSPVLTRPAYSSISFGFVPAASTRLGPSISSGTAASLAGGGRVALEPLAERAGPPAGEALEQPLRVVGDLHRRTVLLAQESLPHRVVEQRGEPVVVAADVEHAHRLAV